MLLPKIWMRIFFTSAQSNLDKNKKTLRRTELRKIDNYDEKGISWILRPKIRTIETQNTNKFLMHKDSEILVVHNLILSLKRSLTFASREQQPNSIFNRDIQMHGWCTNCGGIQTTVRRHSSTATPQKILTLTPKCIEVTLNIQI